jgi:3-methyladenine DNA glycosylase Tag
MIASHTPTSDLYAMGLVLHFLVTGKFMTSQTTLFGKRELKDIKLYQRYYAEDMQALKKHLYEDKKEVFPEAFFIYHFIRLATQPDYEQRMSLDNILEVC